MTGRAMACASITVRPKASGSVEACTTMSATIKDVGMSSVWPTSRTRSCSPQAAMRASNSRRKATLPSPTSTAWDVPGSRAMASTSTPWPFQRVSRPGSMMTARSAASPQLARRSATRAGRISAGSNSAGSTPRGMTRIRDGSVAWRSRTCSAMKVLMAITRSPRAMTEL